MLNSLNKDVRNYILNLLDWKSLIHLNHSNHFYFNMMDQKFWKNKVKSIGLDVDEYQEVNWKKQYIEIRIILDENNMVLSVKKTIQKDRVILLKFLKEKYTLNLTKTYNTGKNTFYDGYNEPSEIETRFIPVYECIRNDSLICFMYIFSLYESNYISYFLINCNRKSKIYEYLQSI